MCRVNITEFRKNIFHYFELCTKEDIYITKNGKAIGILSNPDDSYFKALSRLSGCLKNGDYGTEYKEIIGEEIMKKCGY